MDYSHFKMGFPNLYYHFNVSNMHIWVVLLMKTDSFLFSIIFILFNRIDETSIFGFSCPQYNVLRKNCLFCICTHQSGSLGANAWYPSKWAWTFWVTFHYLIYSVWRNISTWFFAIKILPIGLKELQGSLSSHGTQQSKLIYVQTKLEM